MTPLERFVDAASAPTDIQGHLMMMAELVIDNGFQTVIECGVRSGVSTAAWLYGLSVTGGHLWSVDVDPISSAADGWTSIDGWTFIQGDDLEVADQLPCPADIVFIDTSHTFEQTCAEIDLFVPFISSGGWMLFHDTDAGPTYGVRPALDVKFGDGWVNRPGSSGMGLWQKP